MAHSPKKHLLVATQGRDGRTVPMVRSNMALLITVDAVFSNGKASVLGKGFVHSLPFTTRVGISIIQF